MAEISMKELSKELREAIDKLKAEGTTKDTGIVIRIGDGIAWIYGLKSAGYNEMLEIDGTDGNKITAFALNLMEDEIGAVVLGEDTKIKAGCRVHLTGKVLEVPVGPELVGRVVNPLGQALDGGPAIKAKQTGLVERDAPGVLDRKSVHEPLMTGIVA
ncbi:F0F1 ATP synthase subunit alpha, partial [Candidatus Saccharibacteria bacterium]|nr:F0F1 ATP synthase subunit alpha [Candidatus Saccharibacteria bacterium]